MVPESLCSKAEYTVPILEFVDVQSPLYNKVQEEALDFALPQLSKRHRQCQLRVSMPRFGFTRGMGFTILGNCAHGPCSSLLFANNQATL